MKPANRILSITALSLMPYYAHAIPFTFEGRSLGMGGVSVATADLATAPWANPAMLTNQRPNDDFSLLVGLGAFIRDNEDLITDIDNFQQAEAARRAAVSAGDPGGVESALRQMTSIISGIEGKEIAPEVSGVAAMGIAFESFAMAVSIRADAIAAGTVTDLSCSIIDDPVGCDPNEIISSEYNILNPEGVLATEVGISFAKDFEMLDRKVSIGIKPKVVDLQSFTFRESILTVEAGLDSINEEDVKTDLGTFTTVDIGAAIDISESFRAGLNIRNLLTEKFDIQLGNINGAPLQGQLNLDTEARIGLAYHNNFLTVAVDYDLTENKPLLANPVFESLKTQYLSAGAELNMFDYVQLRFGASRNIASGIPDGAKNTALTAGLGIWLGFNLDIAAIYTEHSLGGFVQTGFRF